MTWFEWDPAKAARNVRKHRVAFWEAVSCFADVESITVPDPAHAWDEERWVLLGRSAFGRILVVVHVEREDAIRIISARPASAAERRRYEEG